MIISWFSVDESEEGILPEHQQEVQQVGCPGYEVVLLLARWVAGYLEGDCEWGRDGRMSGWMNGWTDRWKDERVD